MKPIDRANDFLMRWEDPDAPVSLPHAAAIIKELKMEYEELETALENEKAEVQRCNVEIGEGQRLHGNLTRKLEDLEKELRETRRDEFAGCFLTGRAVSFTAYSIATDEPKMHAREAYRYADAMMEAREE